MRVTFNGCPERLLRHLLVGSAVLLCPISCNYDPGDEITFHQIERVPPIASLSLNGIPPGDTILLFQSADIGFSAGVDKGEIKHIEARVDNRTIESYISNEGQGSFRIYVGSGGLASGTYRLSLEIVSTAATNSIADKLGVETVTTTRVWPLRVDIDQPPAPELVFSESNGFLKVSWEPYVKKNFSSYQVTYGASQYGYNSTRTILISDAQQSFWIDSSYVTGFPLTFEVVTNTVSSFNVGRGDYHHLPLFIMEYEPADSTVSLAWTKPKFANALKSYVVTENSEARVELDNINDTTYRFKLDAICGQRSTISVVFKPSYNGYRDWFFEEDVVEPVLLATLSGPSSFTYNMTLKKLFRFNNSNGKLLSYDEDFAPAGELQLSGVKPSIPGLGNYGYYIEGNSVVRVDLTTGETTSHEESGEIPNTGITSASSTGLVSMSGTVNSQSGPPIAFTQIKQFAADEFIYFRGQKIFETSPPPAAILSDDGKYAYFYGDGEVYRINGPDLTSIGKVSVIVDFRMDDNEELLTTSGLRDVVRIYNTADLSLNRTISAPEAGFTFSFYDPVTNTLLFQNPSSWVKYIIDVESGEVRVIKSAAVYRYISGSIFLDDRHYKKVL